MYTHVQASTWGPALSCGCRSCGGTGHSAPLAAPPGTPWSGSKRYEIPKQICQKEQKFSNFLSGVVVRKGSSIEKSERNIPTTQIQKYSNSCWEPSSFHISHFSFSLIFGMDSVLSKIIWKSYLIMTLLRSWHHLTALICTQLYRNLLTCSVTHMLPWRLLHIAGSAGCLVILATSLIS